MNHFFLFLIFIIVVSSASSCERRGVFEFENNITDTIVKEDTMSRKIKIKVNSQIFSVTLLDNNSTRAFIKMLPMTINMKELNGDEKYYDLPDRLPTNASNPRTIQMGDLMLFGSNTVVLFYKTFSTSYSYTRLGSIDDVSGLATALGSKNVTVTFEVK
jgi:hypothetical protein